MHDVEALAAGTRERQHQRQIRVVLPHPGRRRCRDIRSRNGRDIELVDVEGMDAERGVRTRCREYADVVAARAESASQGMDVRLESAREGLADGEPARRDEADAQTSHASRSS